LIEVEASNVEEEKDKGIEIYDDDTNAKVYEEQINYFRKIVDDYDKISKQIKIIKFMNKPKTTTNTEQNIIVDQLSELEKAFDEVFNFASDNLLNFFIDKNLTSEFVDSIVSKLYQMDVDFKEKFNLFDEEFNLVSKLINKLEEKENYYLELLETINNKHEVPNKNILINDDTFDDDDNIIDADFIDEYINKEINIDTPNDENNNLQIINDKLYIILEYQSIIYKMNSGYIESDIDKISNMLNTIEKL